MRLFIISIAWFSILLPWNGFLDPDAFYHAKMALLLWEQGPTRQFPWLDLTLLGTHFANLHFGFHILLAPFVVVFGLFQGARIATVLFASMSIVTFYACARWLQIRHAFMWAVFLLLSHGFVLRLLLGKATPLAITLFLIGLVAAWKRKPILVFLIAAVYALSHGGWVYLAGSIFLLMCGDVLYSNLVERMAWKRAVHASLWRELIAAWAGGFFGMLIHPNMPAIFTLAWTQLVTIGLGTPFAHVALGNEWLPADPRGFIASLAPWIVALSVGFVGILFAARMPLHRDRARFVVSCGWIVAVLVALTLKSRRNIEFLIPVVTLWCAALWSLVDIKIFLTALKGKGRLWILGFCFALLFGKQIAELWTSFHPPAFRDDAYARSMSAISARAKTGDRVFHSSWDEFPMLFARDDRLRYIAGLDPTFLYVASSTFSDAYRDVTWGVTTTTREQAWSVIHDRARAKFVFVSKKNHGKFLELMKSDTRFVQIADVADSSAFEIQ